ncbi:hypothetical protein B6V73_07510 [Thioclava sp. JM3]|uniref:Lipoprotein n=1 Tax=Thioclava nitratireducens TaxID=1915078 RepID=A0ABN4XEH9_9RHOB|nr:MULTISPECIES: hypothetical protein [Thioclava]AQS48731.1 hypothetical protein BMG03_13705 [Thioclava nitratireducens]OWY01908.1 hypothetical protein B6V75_15230 [Thioclava sp. F1Mire-8]OWY12142.1 hypothetical protein B6V72_13580 [Thioclava sp. F34-6]OWY17501.1 hypothetical protein B6V73_07510 [Thioclava sp. JM3]
MRFAARLAALSLLAPLALAACVPGPGTRAPSWPDKISFRGTVMQVSFNDGTNCHANISGQYTGDLVDCPYPMRYQVTRFEPSYLAGSGVGDLFQPYAEVTLKDAAGRRWHFKTPRDVPPHARGEGQIQLPQ